MTTRKKHILIVDDDQGIRRVLTESLRLLGYELYCFESAEEALEGIKNRPVELALLDINLPGINGLEFCKRLRAQEETRDLPVVMMTAFYKDADHIRQAREHYGATDYLLKPFPLNKLHEKISELIGLPLSSGGASKLSVKGSLSRTHLPQILHNLYEIQATGLLHLENDSIKKIIYIRNGYPIFVRSNVVNEFLGQILLRQGLLTEDDLKSSLDYAKEKGQRHGMALIELGLLTPQELNSVLHDQVVNKLLEAFSWKEGNFQFVQVREFKQNVTQIDMSPSNLILQGLRHHAPEATLENILEPHKNSYLHYTENPLYRFQEISLTPSEQQILNKYDGQITFGEFLKAHLLSKHTINPVFATLLTTGILTASDAPLSSATVEESNDSIENQNDEETLRRKTFLEEYAWMMDQDHFSLLGVSETDSPGKVRKAYYELVKKYHPDRFFEQEILLDLKDKVHSLFQRVTEAYETLSDSSLKQRYINELKGNKDVSVTSLDAILEAEKEFHRGQVLLRVGKFSEASKAFTEAVKLHPTENEFLIFQAWANFKSQPDSTEVANMTKASLSRILQDSPKLSNAHLFLAYVHKKLGNNQEAKKHFEKTVQLDPNCTEALREIRLMSLRQQQAKAQKGLFKKKTS